MTFTRLFALSCVLFSALFAGLAAAQPIDFTSPDGPDRTCPRYLRAEPAKLRSDADRAAYAICNTIDLVREAARRFSHYQAEGQRNDNALVNDLRARLEQIAVRVRDSRVALEGVKGAGPYFPIRPGDWVIDWNGDGRIEDHEKYLLWVPRRNLTEFQPMHRFGSFAAHREALFVSPQIKLDRADALWAAAYLQFLEAALNLVLSYEVNLDQGFAIRLKDPARIAKVAHPRLLGGIRTSGLLRQALLKETDDDDEWIPNPKQTRTSFPLVMDAQTFDTWGQLLGHMEKLFRGQTLLGGTVDSQEFRNVRDLSGGLCPPGQGIDVHSLFTRPIREPLNGTDELRSRCALPSAKRPMTGLAAMIAESVRRNAGRTPGSFSGEWMILRHFYWVN
jgi:hypothetical protein